MSPRKKTLAPSFAAAFVVATALAGSAQAGTLYFDLEGTNPDRKGGYRGAVSLTEVADGQGGEKSGIVTWKIGNAAPVIGVALSTPDAPTRLSISFPGRPVPGVALATIMPGGTVQLLWYVGGRTAGTETWTPQ